MFSKGPMFESDCAECETCRDGLTRRKKKTRRKRGERKGWRKPKRVIPISRGITDEEMLVLKRQRLAEREAQE